MRTPDVLISFFFFSWHYIQQLSKMNILVHIVTKVPSFEIKIIDQKENKDLVSFK